MSEGETPPVASPARPPGEEPTAAAVRPATAPHPVLDRYYPSEGDRHVFLTTLFDGAARHYEMIGRIMALGSGTWYRRQALGRAGLRPGMTLLDVATGTGQVARAAAAILGDPRPVIGIDPSAGMLREARKAFAGPLVRGRAETLPFSDERFDMLTMGYALRHVSDLGATFREYRRVLRPGGRLLLLEISRPRRAATRWLLRTHFRRVLPAIMRIGTRNPQPGLLMKYYWDTIDACVPPETVLGELRQNGFLGVERRVFFGLLSEYVAAKAPRA